jgi:hypothetical protein
MGWGVHSGRTRLLAALLGACAAMALPPAGALADAGANLRHAPPESAAFTVAGSNGYSIYVRKQRGQVEAIVSRKRPPMPTIAPDGRLLPANRGDVAADTYFTTAASTDPNTIEADLGALGRIAVSFQPSGRRRVTRVDLSGKSERCVGATKIVRRLGTFTGTISFHGENGYTSVDLESAPGSVGTSPFRNCTTRPDTLPHPGHPAKRPTEASLWLSGKTAVVLSAFGSPQGARFFAIAADGLDGSLTEVRTAQAVGPASEFRFHLDGSGATLRPAGPFSGTGVYRDGAHSPPSWRGGLAVEFPGATVPLTGPGTGTAQMRIYPAR